MLVHERLHYIGPNRRSPRTVIEWLLELEAGEGERLQRARSEGFSGLTPRLRTAGLAGDEWRAGPEDTLPPDADPLDAACRIVARLAVRLQQAAGHDVHFHSVLPLSRADRRRLVFEYEHDETGEDAGEIALRLLAESVPNLSWMPQAEVPGADAVGALQAFLDRARDQVLPRDTQAIIDAAARLDVPCAKLEREPYHGLTGQFRIRPGGLLRLGQSRNLRVVDGTLCLEHSAQLTPLLFDRQRLLVCMRELRLPLPRPGAEGRPQAAGRRVARFAAALGYPVVLKPVRRLASEPRGFDRTRPALRDEAELLAELERLRPHSPQVLIEQHVSGETWHLLAAGGNFLCAVRGDGAVIADGVHDSLRTLVEEVAAKIDCGLLSLAVVGEGIDRPLTENGGAVVSLDPAPQLDRLLPAQSPWLADAAEAFVRWLYPPGTPSRIPLVAVTGTNGKTTTSRLVARIARESGHVPGLATTFGVYVGDELRKQGDLAGVGGHHLLFEAREADFGVLETARGGVAHSGFMFDHCEVGVCVNVTPDHIGEFGIETLADMIAIKRSILERATRGVVLNADYTTTLGMLPFPPGVRVGLCSLSQAAPRLLEQAGQDGLACVLERAGGTASEWLVCYEQGQRLPLVAATDYPAALGGAARVNLSNAQHAILAARLMGFGCEAIARALRGFDASFENNPGRLNLCRDYPFTVIMDYAHNPDGLTNLLDCVDRMGGWKRRILLYAMSGNRTDAEVVTHTLCPVGRVDHYVLRRYPGSLRGRQPHEIPAIMHAALLNAGVPEERITVEPDPEQGAWTAMRLARPGDLVILSPGAGEFVTMWEKILAFRSELPADGPAGAG